MDQGKNRMRLIELEEDLEYNISRKEELKKEVRKLKDQYESTYEVYMKNTKVAMDQNVEIADLKAVIEQKIKENNELHFENNKIKDSLRDMESSNRYYKDVIKSKEEGEDKLLDELKDSNQNLKLQVENLLQCNDFDSIFDDKAKIFKHIKSNHSERNCSDCNSDNFDDRLGIKCNRSDQKFQLKSDLEKQKMKGHIRSSREDILRRQTELLKKLTLQKVNIGNSLYKLKQIENKKKVSCSCKGFCRILHSRFRWKYSQSDVLFGKF